MKLINTTGVPAAYHVGLEASGRELLVVVVKATFSLPADDRPQTAWRLHGEQVPLVLADVYTGEPGQSAPLYESDLAPTKTRCDVLLQGRAHAPGGHATTRVEVGLQLGRWAKRFAVVGARRWRREGQRIVVSTPEPFITQAIGYESAFGGSDPARPDSALQAAHAMNPVGTGFRSTDRPDARDTGGPMPTSEESATPVVLPHGAYRPMAFGPVARAWPPRVGFAGTYDQAWQDHGFPFLPADFDDRYHQAAPEDQQIPFEQLNPSAEQIVLTNLSAHGDCSFVVPTMPIAARIELKRGPAEDAAARLDTVLIEPELQRCCLTWRLTRPLRQNVFDIAQLMIGPAF
jgi:hypothetical protein